MGRRGRRTREMVDIAQARIEYLKDIARKNAREGALKQSQISVEHAIRLGMRYNLRMGKEFRNEYCRNCRSYLVPGRNARIRLNRGMVSLTCLECNAVKRVPYHSGHHGTKKEANNTMGEK
jgi:ribonuclease P protein subunit RPR2